MKWTPRGLIEGCEKLLRRDDTTVRLARSSSKDACCRYSDGPIEIEIMADAFRVGLIPGVLHELLHALLSKDLDARFSDALEECLVRRLEEKLWNEYFAPQDVRRWRRLLKKKLGRGK